jgi:flavodoxin
MKTIKRTTYTKKDFNNVIIPTWQRWKNEKNVKDLSEAVYENGQLRDVLVCVTKDGTKILTDGNHLYNAIFNCLKYRQINVLEKKVKNNEEARETFISFNTRGKSLKTIDYIVSYAGSGNKDYKKFLIEVMKSPNNLKEAENVYGKLFTIPALINIFLGQPFNVKKGNCKLHKNHNRLLEVVEYLGQNYLYNGKLIKHLNKNGRAMKLNGGSIIPVFEQIKNNNKIMCMSNSEILDLLIDFTFYHYNSMQNCTFTKDAICKSFNVYLKGL